LFFVIKNREQAVQGINVEFAGKVATEQLVSDVGAVRLIGEGCLEYPEYWL
jgi:hypothetical protein